MQISLENEAVQCTIDPQNTRWSIYSKTIPGALIENATISVQYIKGRTRFKALSKWHNPRIHTQETISSPHGSLKSQRITIGPDKNSLVYTLTFALPENHPLLLWKITIDNTGKSPVKIGSIHLLHAGTFRKKSLIPKGDMTLIRSGIPRGGHGVIRLHHHPGESAFFSNGWQSWSYTGASRAATRPVDTRLGIFARMMWYSQPAAKTNIKGRFTSDMFGVLGDLSHRTGILAGFLSQRQQFGTLEVQSDSLYPAMHLFASGDNAVLPPGNSLSTDWAVISFIDIDRPDPLAAYLDAVARENGKHSPDETSPAGWCSWYHYFQNISEADIRKNLHISNKLRDKLPLEIIQIDDGYQKQVGDWQIRNDRFPHGIAPLAAEIKDAGFVPGLWIAPFIVHPASELARRHRDWLIKNKFGFPANAGFVWNAFTHALDLTNPAVSDYIDEIITTAVHKWGYPYLKLDFLYAAAISGKRHDPTKTRAQILRQGLERIRKAAGDDTVLLGCGCPLGSAVGLADAMRIGADVSPTWFPRFEGHELFLRNEPSMPSTRNALQNTITRAFLHKHWWINDPDCLLLGTDTDLTLAEVRTLASVIALTGGSLLISDDLEALPPERLRIAQSILPLIGKPPHIPDWLDNASPRIIKLDLENTSGKWHLFGIVNWEHSPVDVNIPLSQLAIDPDTPYYARSFWDGSSLEIREARIDLGKIPAHGIKVFSLRPIGENNAAYLGGNLHISQGSEITAWQESESRLAFTLERPGKETGFVDLYLPRKAGHAVADGQTLPLNPLANNTFRLHLTFDKRISVRIPYD